MLIWLVFCGAIWLGWYERRLSFDCGLVNVNLIVKSRRPVSCFCVCFLKHIYIYIDNQHSDLVIDRPVRQGNFWPRSHQSAEVCRAIRSKPVLINPKSFQHRSNFSLIVVILRGLVDSASCSKLLNRTPSLWYPNRISETQVSRFKIKCPSRRHRCFACVRKHVCTHTIN